MSNLPTFFKPQLQFLDTCGQAVAGFPGIDEALAEISQALGIHPSAIRTHSQLNQALDAMCPKNVSIELQIDNLERVSNIIFRLAMAPYKSRTDLAAKAYVGIVEQAMAGGPVTDDGIARVSRLLKHHSTVVSRERAAKLAVEPAAG